MGARRFSYVARAVLQPNRRRLQGSTRELISSDALTAFRVLASSVDQATELLAGMWTFRVWSFRIEVANVDLPP